MDTNDNRNCICPENGESHLPLTYYCTTCDTVIMENKLSANYLFITLKAKVVGISVADFDENIY